MRGGLKSYEEDHKPRRGSSVSPLGDVNPFEHDQVDPYQLAEKYPEAA